MLDSTMKLSALREEFLASSSQSMPIAGMIFWATVGVAALYLRPDQTALTVGFGSGMIFPLGLLIDRLTGRKVTRASGKNPVTQMFLQSMVLVVLVWPMVLIAAYQAGSGNLVVLGGAILMGIIWIPYGWAANDPVGLQHAVGRAVLSYAAYLFAPERYRASAISAVVLLSYLYSLVRMRKPPAGSAAPGL